MNPVDHWKNPELLTPNPPRCHQVILKGWREQAVSFSPYLLKQLERPIRCQEEPAFVSQGDKCTSCRLPISTAHLSQVITAAPSNIIGPSSLEGTDSRVESCQDETSDYRYRNQVPSVTTGNSVHERLRYIFHPPSFNPIQHPKSVCWC